MKTTILSILIFVVGTFSLQAQTTDKVPGNTLKIGYGTSFLSQESIIGRTKYIEFDRRLFRPVSIAASVSAFNGSKTVEDKDLLANNLNIDGILYFSPLGNKFNKLKLGLGASYLKAENNFLEEANYEAYGAIAALDYEVYIAKHLVVGSKAAFNYYMDSKDKSFYWGLNVGLRF